MGWIVSMGIADSSNAKPLREVLCSHRLLEIADLESLSGEVFTSGMATRGTVAPIILIVEKVSKPEPLFDYDVPVVLVDRDTAIAGGKIDLNTSSATAIGCDLFFDEGVNPARQFITKLREKDAPILRKLMDSKLNLEDCSAPLPSGRESRAIQFGVKKGSGTGKIANRPSPGAQPMLKGSHVHTFVLNENAIEEYLFVKKADSIGLWAYDALLSKPAFCVSTIGFALQAARFYPKDIVAQNTTVVMIPRDDLADFPWDAYLNSGPVRFIFGLLGRSALVEGNEYLWRSTIYPRTLKMLPVTQRLLDAKANLSMMASDLRKLAKGILNAWDHVDTSIQKSEKVFLGTLDVKFLTLPNPSILTKVVIEAREHNGDWILAPKTSVFPDDIGIVAARPLLEMLKYMIESPVFRFVPKGRTKVPVDHVSIGNRIIEILSGSDIGEFKEKMNELDQTVGECLGLSKRELSYVLDRLKTYPFNHMEPRWPWVRAAIRPTRVYETDRFG